MKKTILVIVMLAAIVIVIGGYFFISNSSTSYQVEGVKIQISKQGSGNQAKKGDVVTLHYTGTLVNGQKFDSSYDRNLPFTFILDEGSVIRGFDVGVLGMRVGEKRKITIPPELSYGSVELSGIPANSTLIYEIELLTITQKPSVDTQPTGT